jgi:hypothetical protein
MVERDGFIQVHGLWLKDANGVTMGPEPKSMRAETQVCRPSLSQTNREIGIWRRRISTARTLDTLDSNLVFYPHTIPTGVWTRTSPFVEVDLHSESPPRGSHLARSRTSDASRLSHTKPPTARTALAYAHRS